MARNCQQKKYRKNVLTRRERIRKMRGVGGKIWTTNLTTWARGTSSPNASTMDTAAMRRARMTASALRAGRLSNDCDFDLWRTACAGNRSQSASAEKTSRARECAMGHRAAAMGITVRPHRDISTRGVPAVANNGATTMTNNEQARMKAKKRRDMAQETRNQAYRARVERLKAALRRDEEIRQQSLQAQ